MAKKPMNWTKAAIGAATAGAMLSATPALARDRYDHRDRDGIGAGEIIAGAVVLGGLAAILSADNDRYDRYDRNDRRSRDRYNDPRYGYGSDYGRYGNSRAAVGQCVRAVERGTSYSVIPWQMGVVAKILRILPNWLYDRLFTSAPRKPRGLLK